MYSAIPEFDALRRSLMIQVADHYADDLGVDLVG